MSQTATELNKLSDDQVEKELKDLQAKTDVTPEEKEKLSGLKEERQTRYEKKIKHLHSEKLAEKNKREQLEKDLAEQKAELEKIKAEKHVQAKPKIVDETVEIGGKKFYTDDSLTSMVASEELTPQQAYAHQRARDKAEIIQEIETKENAKSKEATARREFEDDKKKVLEDYPQFNPSDPNHDPEDPLYKTASEIWIEGYQNNPRGLSLAIKRAKQILRMSDTRPDVSNEHSVGRSRGTEGQRHSGETEEKLDATEQEAAYRMYRGIVNPATGRNYTEAESIIKATKAKTARMRR